jgi:hypothetical protein
VVGVKKGPHGTAEELLVAVTSELAGDGAGFVAEGKECRLDVDVL